jgi:hypothetical protein
VDDVGCPIDHEDLLGGARGVGHVEVAGLVEREPQRLPARAGDGQPELALVGAIAVVDVDGAGETVGHVDLAVQWVDSDVDRGVIGARRLGWGHRSYLVAARIEDEAHRFALGLCHVDAVTG